MCASLPSGYFAAREAVHLGREFFFGSPDAELPLGRIAWLQQDDLIPQFGFVGKKYQATRMLLLGINPGNGPSNVRKPWDAKMMPVLNGFLLKPTPSNFQRAQEAWCKECVSSPFWKRHCGRILRECRLDIQQIAYSNCLPWRTESKSQFSATVAQRTARHYIEPLLNELNPHILVAMGKKCRDVLESVSHDTMHVVVWDRSQALTDRVRKERERAIDEIKALLS